MYSTNKDTEVKIEVNKIEFGEENVLSPIGIDICSCHTPEKWMTGDYRDNKDGTITCIYCPWGTRLPGYTRCINGKILDLRTVNS